MTPDPNEVAWLPVTDEVLADNPPDPMLWEGTGRVTAKGTQHRGRHTTQAGVTKRHPIAGKPAARRAKKAARRSRKQNR